MAFLSIIEDEGTFEYSPKDPQTGDRMQTVFELRVVPDAVTKELRRKFLRPRFENHQRIEELDHVGLQAALMDYAIVGWRGLKWAHSQDDVPCTTERKAQLPQWVKEDVVRLCALHEAGIEVAQAEQEKKRSAPISTAKPTPSAALPVA